jgi:hypothetical protein
MLAVRLPRTMCTYVVAVDEPRESGSMREAASRADPTHAPNHTEHM